MSNYIEYNDKVAFHPGYYLKELVDESGLSQEDFAKRLGTTPKNLSLLIRGEQRLSNEIALKLSRMFGTSIGYWLGLQQSYDERIAESLSAKELEIEREVFKRIDYQYFRENFDLPDLPRKVDEQIKYVREFLCVSSLTVLKNEDFAVSFRRHSKELSAPNIVANVMVQIAINRTLNTQAPQYNRKDFENAISFALTQTKNHKTFIPLIEKAFRESGVVLVVLPNLKNSGINGATKKIDGKRMLLVNDRGHYADTFWFTLFHEIGHILHGDLGITYNDESEDDADLYARNALIPQDKYEEFVSRCERFGEKEIVKFAESIDQDAGIVLGRLMKDKKVKYTETYLSNKLRHKYRIVIK